MGHAAGAAATQHDGHGGTVAGPADRVHLRPDADDGERVAFRIDAGGGESGLRRREDGSQAGAGKDQDAFEKIHSKNINIHKDTKNLDGHKKRQREAVFFHLLDLPSLSAG